MPLSKQRNRERMRLVRSCVQPNANLDVKPVCNLNTREVDRTQPNSIRYAPNHFGEVRNRRYATAFLDTLFSHRIENRVP